MNSTYVKLEHIDYVIHYVSAAISDLSKAKCSIT